MSNIQKLITEIKTGGIQDGSRFSVSLYVKDLSVTIPPERIIGIDLPGPKYEFINCNYWLGNQYFRMPVGIKFEEQLIIQTLVPEKTNSSFFNFLAQYTGKNFSQINSGRFFAPSGEGSFSFKRQIQGIRIEVTAIDRFGNNTGNYNYGGCYLEKIMPFRFAADKSEPQTMSLSFLVGAMYNR